MGGKEREKGTHSLPRLRVQVDLNPLLLLFQPLFRLAQILTHRMPRNKGLRLALVERPRRREEGGLKVRLVEVEVLPVGVVCVQAEGD